MKHLDFKGTGVAVRPLTVFLHGFPGVRSKQNRDIAEETAKVTNRRCLVPFYPGLGIAEGEFSFRECRDQVEAFVDDLIKQHGSVDLVGHSWGGYQSLRLAAKYGDKIGRVVLMSPLIKFYNVATFKKSFIETFTQNPQLNLGTFDERAVEFESVGNEISTPELAARLHPLTKVVLLQAKGDPTTPDKHAEDLLSHFKSPPLYNAVATDHSFLENRADMIRLVIEALELDYRAD